MKPKRPWVMPLLAGVGAEVLLVAGLALCFEPTIRPSQYHAATAIMGLGALFAMLFVIDRLVTDAVPAVVVGLKLAAMLVFCSSGASTLMTVIRG